jgi:hypothetical protein
MDVPASVTSAVRQHPSVVGVQLVGSRGHGNPTALSDWDFQIDTTDARALARDLPALVESLDPVAAQWDRLTEHATYMLMLPGAVKIDLFPGDERRELEPPWEPAPSNLEAIDAHFWDWVLWLGSKYLHGQGDLVGAELRKLQDNLLGPLGIATAPATIDAAVTQYGRARDRLERRWSISVDRRLGDEVSMALRDNHVINGR